MPIESEKDLQQLKNRFRDLAEKSYRQGIYTFTGFLGLSEQDVFHRLARELEYAGYAAEGGTPEADRKMIRFGNPQELGYEADFPIACIHITPLLKKFADKLSHRDFLGALMNLGIERDILGDIKVGEQEAWLFCQENMAEFVCENLGQVKHTSVLCKRADDISQIPAEEPEILGIQVSSVRVDAVIAKVYNKSRGDCLELFRTGKVYIDGRLCENNSRMLKPGETINVRGYGKFVFSGESRETRKGKLALKVAVYR